MSIFITPDIDTAMIFFVNPFCDFFNLILVNKYYHDFIIHHDLYHKMNELFHDYKKYHSCEPYIYNEIFIIACRLNNPLRFYLIKNYKINIHCYYKEPFQTSCQYGHIDVAKWLIELGQLSNFTPIDIHCYDERAFRLSCQYGHLHIAKWLFELSNQSDNTQINFRVDDDYIFKSCYMLNRINIIQWLATLCSKYQFVWDQHNNTIMHAFVAI